MNERVADLHLHTNFSDGTLTPEELVENAARIGLAAIAVTDHDSVGGVERAQTAGKRLGVRVLAGVELSATDGRSDVHILGYAVDPDNTRFRRKLDEFREARVLRAEKMVEKLREIGAPIEMEEVREAAGEGAIGRPHVATVLHRRGHTGNFAEAFRRFIGLNGPAYVPKMQLSLADAVTLLRETGAVAAMAHPGIVCRDDLIPELVAAGMQGLEVVHSRHDGQAVQHYRRIAEEHRLVPTGGSDSHGGRDRPGLLLGKFVVPAFTLDEIERRRRELPGYDGS